MSIYFGADSTVLHSGDVGGGKILQVKRTERTAVRTYCTQCALLV